MESDEIKRLRFIISRLVWMRVHEDYYICRTCGSFFPDHNQHCHANKLLRENGLEDVLTTAPKLPPEETPDCGK